MADYKSMYLKTFNALTDAHRLLEQALSIIETAQQESENIFIDTNEVSVSEKIKVIK